MLDRPPIEGTILGRSNAPTDAPAIGGKRRRPRRLPGALQDQWSAIYSLGTLTGCEIPHVNDVVIATARRSPLSIGADVGGNNNVVVLPVENLFCARCNVPHMNVIVLSSPYPR